MIYIQIAASIQSAVGEDPLARALLESAAQRTLQHAAPQREADLSLALSDDKQIQRLNRQFLDIDAPTDVLAFPSSEIDPDSQVEYLGDVIISYPRALAQSTAGGHSIKDELCLLVVHGVLHLLGYDHSNEQEKAAMWAQQDHILALLGCKITSPDR
jgi:probable rRNA maturation factor